MNEYFIPQVVFDENLPFSIELAGITYADKTYKISRKQSPIICVEYILSGSGTVTIDKNTFYPSAGDTYILLPGSNHKYCSNENDPWEKMWFNARGKLVNDMIDAYGLATQTVFRCNTKPFIEEIFEILKSKSLLANDIADKTALVFHELIQFLSKHKKNSSPFEKEAVTIKNYIDSHLHSQITIDTLAKLIYKSPSQTTRIFKKCYGKAPYDYYTDVRLKKAIFMIKSTNLSIKEISQILGFCDEHYFTFFFHKKTGKSPKEFRQK